MSEIPWLDNDVLETKIFFFLFVFNTLPRLPSTVVLDSENYLLTFFLDRVIKGISRALSCLNEWPRNCDT